MNITGITLAEAWRNGGPLMWVLAGLSVIALAIVLYLLVAQRRGALVPRALVSDVFSRLQTGDHGEARRLCQRRPCAFGVLVLAALDAVRGAPQGSRPPVATAVETAVMATRPTKLQTTLMRMAVLTLMERVPTASAMALAASVAPLTKMVPRTSAMVTARNGFCASMPRKVEKLIKSNSPRRLRASYPSYVPGCAASSASGP